MNRQEAIDKVAPRLSHIHNMEIPKKIKWIQDLVHECYDSFDKELKKQKIWGMRKRDEAHKMHKVCTRLEEEIRLLKDKYEKD